MYVCWLSFIYIYIYLWGSNKLSILLRVSCFMQSSGIQFYFYKPKKTNKKYLLYQNTKYTLLDLNPYYLLMKAFSAIIYLDGNIY